MNNKNVNFDNKRTSQWLPNRNQKTEKEVFFYAYVLYILSKC
jgi:hypothetical protein